MSKLGKEISSHEQKKGELSINGDSQNDDARNVSVITDLQLLSFVYCVFMLITKAWARECL